MSKKNGQHKASPNNVNIFGNSTIAQRQRLLAALREAPRTTVWIRRELDLLMPAARVYELRHNQGFNILTNWKYAYTEGGKEHYVAEYVLMPGKWQGGEL